MVRKRSRGSFAKTLPLEAIGAWPICRRARDARSDSLRGLWQHAPYFHNGSAATVEDVVKQYYKKMSLGLTPAEVSDLGHYLKSLSARGSSSRIGSIDEGRI